MDVEDINTQRFEVALDLFENGKLLRFNRIGFLISGERDLDVQVESTWQIENVTSKTADSDRKRAETTLEYLVTNSERFAKLISGRQRNLSLIYFDGRDSIELGRFFG